jgi:hypothetical protein
MTSFTIVDIVFVAMVIMKKKEKKIFKGATTCLFILIHLSRSNDKQRLEKFNILR